MRNFDLFVGIDWSGAKAPVNNRAIAVALAWQGTDEAPHISGKVWSRSAVADWICALAEKRKRVFVGIDCNFGYSQRVGEAQFGPAYTYADLWQAVEETSAQCPNYFAGGYWMDPAYRSWFWTEGKQPQDLTMPKRLTEVMCGEAGYGWPESPFKLIGAKQVGKGGLSGMRMALDLQKRLGSKICFWPFDTHADDAVVVVTEIYPRQFLRRAGHGNAKVRDIGSLDQALRALGCAEIDGRYTFSDHEADALVSAAGLRYLCGRERDVPDVLAVPPALDRKTAQREGWIFGVGDK